MHQKKKKDKSKNYKIYIILYIKLTIKYWPIPQKESNSAPEKIYYCKENIEIDEVFYLIVLLSYFFSFIVLIDM